MIAEVAADFRLRPPGSTAEEAEGNSNAGYENNESMLRSLFRVLRTMDNAHSLDEKPVPSADGRRALR
jgi:hypothetical protein